MDGPATRESDVMLFLIFNGLLKGILEIYFHHAQLTPIDLPSNR